MNELENNNRESLKWTAEVDALDYLEGCRIVSFDLSDDKKTVNVMEECDRYYSIDLNKTELACVIHALTKLLVNMEPVENE